MAKRAGGNVAIEWQRVGAYVRCQDDNKRLLLTRFEIEGHPDSGSWTMPGGGMEFGEQPADTAQREFTEETGLSVELGPLITVVSYWFDAHTAFRGTRGQAVAVLFGASNPQGVLKTNFADDDSTVDARWFSLDEIADLRRIPLVDFAVSTLTS